MKKLFLTGTKWTSINSIFNFVSGLATIIILTRLIDKSDFGLMALSNVIIGFSTMFIDIGVSNAVIYKDEIKREETSTLFWLNITLGVFLFLTVIFLRPIFTWFFQEPRLHAILLLTSLAFPFYSVGILHKTLLVKHLQFRTIALINLTAVFCATFVKIYFAVLGFGVFSLVWGTLILSFLSSILFFFHGKKYFIPGRYFNLKDIGFYLNFGAFQLGEKILNYFTAQFDTIIIGKTLGSDVLGIYDIFKQILMKPGLLINPILNQITFPIFSKEKHDNQLLKSTYQKIIKYNSILNFPIYLGLIAVSEPLIQFIFPSSYSEYSYVFIFLGLYFLSRSLINPVGGLVLSMGRVDLSFYWNVYYLIILPVSLLIGSKFGIVGITIALFTTHFMSLIFHIKFFLKRLINLGYYEYFASVKGSLYTAILMAIIAFSIVVSLQLLLPFRLAVAILIGFLVYLFIIYRLYPVFFQNLKKVYLSK